MLPTLVIQKDGTIVADSLNPGYEQVREQLLLFCDLVMGNSRLHVYRMSKLTLWQAAARGFTARSILEVLRCHASHGVPYEVQQRIVSDLSWWGRVRLVEHDNAHFALVAAPEDLNIIAEACKLPRPKKKTPASQWVFPISARASVKMALAKKGFPCVDELRYQDSARISAGWRDTVCLRGYQQDAVRSFLSPDARESGVIVLPCGSGKTIVGIAAMIELGVETLILTPTDTAAAQWRQEILDKTTMREEDISLYRESGAIFPVTIVTYPRVAASNQSGARRHLEALSSHAFGLVIYDEVHMLPAPLFRLAADMQSARRLGLTATLVREDGAETDVFTLIGPKCYETEWKELERQGYLANVRCVEVRVPLGKTERDGYEVATRRARHKIAALNAQKLFVAIRLIERHRGDPVLLIGHYLEHLHQVAKLVGCPIISGATPLADREKWFEAFRNGSMNRLVLSRVANMSVDIPRASVIIQLSGLYGSRQEEAQRLGRLLRPDSGPGVFYTLVTVNSVEAEMSQHRSLFLVEQGYRYEIVTDLTELVPDPIVDPMTESPDTHTLLRG